ncbi:MAG: ABC transporter substrate-binding protein [Clostridia bacterium]|nr:ABC transporter substrate-binding protein [Clostridia bacterium]
MNKKKFLAVLIAIVMVLSLAACGGSGSGSGGGGSQPDASVPTQDREGNDISIPEKVERIVSLAPATTQILESVGKMDQVVGVGTQTPFYVSGVDSLPQFDMMEPDIEAIAALEPDIVFTSGMSYIEGDPYSALIDLGICVVVIPSSNSLEGVKEDILFTAACVGETEKAQAIVDEMQKDLDEIAEIGKTITEKKTVAFEISALPYIYSTGKGTFIDEMITLIGAENVYGDQESWIPVAEEDAVAANPDVILTSVNYLPDAVGEIMGRPGWEEVKAVKNGEVYYIDNASSSLPNQYVVKALLEMAKAVYPEYYGEVELDLAA